MQEFYTNAQVWGSNLLVRGFDDEGRAFKSRILYEPTLYEPTDKKTEFKDIHGIYQKPRHFSSIKKAKDYVKLYDGVVNKTVNGLTSWQYPYLNECYQGVDYDFKKIKIFNIDIETECENGFPHAWLAEEEVNAITIGYKDKFFSFGCHDYTPKLDTVNYMKCRDEKQLLTKFVNFWARVEPDIITGWHIDGFDIPYLVNRITKILGDDWAKKLSPWGIVREKSIRARFGTEIQSYDIVGVSSIDYMSAYKKFMFTTPENMKLDTIAQLELGEKKLDYSEVHGLQHSGYKPSVASG